MCLRPKWESKVIEEAISWIGTPYHMGATLKGVGVDCGTFLTEVYRRAGIVSDKIQLEHFPIDWFLHTREEKYLGHIERYCVGIDLGLPARVVLFQYGRIFSHGGIIVEWPIIVHAWKNGVEYGDATKAPLSNRKHKFYEPISIG